MKYKNGSKEIENRILKPIFKIDNRYNSKQQITYNQKELPPILKNDKDINNNILKNNYTNERYEHNKPIIITTNFTENQVIDIFTVGKNKSSIEAIMSRLNEICLTVKILDNDYRYKP